MSTFLPIFALVCALFTACSQPAQTSRLTVSQTQENAGQQGLPLVSSERPTLVAFWATWCGPCREDFPALEAVARDHRGSLRVVLVSIDTPAQTHEIEKIAQIVEDACPSALSGIDLQGEVQRALNVDGLVPTHLLIDTGGRVVWRRVGTLRSHRESFGRALESLADKIQRDTRAL